MDDIKICILGFFTETTPIPRLWPGSAKRWVSTRSTWAIIR